MYDKLSTKSDSLLSGFIASKSFKVRALKILLLSLPVFGFGIGLLRSGNNIAPGDADYYMQLYEAARTSILDFHQIPWWNPWMSGGIPLFANPQFGPISIQMLTTLLFGSVFGYKLALVLYLVIGFFGMRRLLLGVYNATRLHASLLSYIWVFSSFFVYRSGGHFTFFVVGFLPWLIYFFLKRGEGRNWLWFAIVSSLLIWSSMHYTTVLAFFIIALFGLGDFIRCFLVRARKKKRERTLSYVWKEMSINKLLFGFVIILLLTFPKLYATLEFSHDYPRILSQNSEHTTPIDITLYALFSPDQYSNPPKEYVVWSWMETSSYIGILTSIVLLATLIIYVQKDTKRTYRSSQLLLIVALCLLLARADFASWAPFTLLREVPVFSSMRVATRWIAWAAFFILLFIGSMSIRKYKKTYVLVSAIMFITVVELFIVGFSRLNDPYILSIKENVANTRFTQRAKWDQHRLGVPYDENFTEATRNNIGQIIAGDSLVDTRYAVKTVRCDELDPRCHFITANAEVLTWTPNKITLKRLGSGPIALNVNPGSHWEVNGSKDKSIKIVDPSLPFIIYDTSDLITLEYMPPYTLVEMAKSIFSRTRN